MISNHDKVNLLKEFPNIKLSYEKLTHKIVYNAELYLAIPVGRKCFAWFTQYNCDNVCLIMELGNNKCVNNIKISNVCFSDELSYGTIIYGTVFNHNNNDFFSIEDIYYFKGKSVETDNWGNKLLILNDLFKNNLKPISYNKSFIIFGLPIMCDNFNNIIEAINGVKYKISSIQFKYYNNCNKYYTMGYTDIIQNIKLPQPHLPIKDTEYIKPLQSTDKYKRFNNINLNTHNTNYDNNYNNIIINNNKISKSNTYTGVNININNNNNNKNKKEAIFNVKPDLQQDIYHLYCIDENNSEKYVGLASISDYKTSVMMNKLFRIIKENDNLDALEESDDEEEFENDKVDLFVHLDKEYKMVCAYNYKFKKWYPIRLAENNAKITLSNNL